MRVLLLVVVLSVVASCSLARSSAFPWPSFANRDIVKWLSQLPEVNLQEGERLFMSKEGAVFFQFTNIESLAGSALTWNNPMASSWPNPIPLTYEVTMQSVDVDKRLAGCWLHMFEQFGKGPAWNRTFDYDRSAEISDWEVLYNRGYLTKNYEFTSSGVDDPETNVTYTQWLKVGSLYRIDVQPGSWFNPSMPYLFSHARLRQKICGENAADAWSCLFNEDKGLFSGVVTGIVVASDVYHNSSRSNGSSASSNTFPGVPMVAALVGRRLPYWAPFCGEPIDPL